MESIRRFAYLIRDLFYSPASYKAAGAAPLRKPLKMLALISGVWATIAAFLLAAGIFALLQSDIVSKVADTYPPELVINIKDGVASTNVAQPYPIFANASSSAEVKAFAIIDTRPEVTLEELSGYDAPVVLTHKRVFFSESGDMRTVEFSDIQSFTLDKAKVDAVVEKVRPYLNATLFLLPVLLFFLLIGGSVLLYMALGLAAAFIVVLWAKFQGLSFDFRTSYMTALHAFIPVALVQLLFGIHFFLSLAVFLVIIVTNIQAHKHS